MVVIQKAFKRHLERKKIKEEQKRVMERNKQKWRKKIGGDAYGTDSDEHDTRDGMNNELEPLENISQDYEYKRRKEFLNGKNANINAFDAGVGQIAMSHDHRRKRFDDLKSVEQRKKEQELNEPLYRSYD